MQIIVDVPNSLYANLSKITNGSIATKRILDCVKYGTPLPKGHGRLIDADALRCENADFDTYNDYCTMFDEIEAADTIIEADTESKGKESCDNCKHNTESWDSDACDGCCVANSKWSGESYPGEFEAMEHNGRLDALESEEQDG